MVLKLNLSVREQDTLVNYNYFNPILIGDENITTNSVNFHIPTLIREVNSTPKNKLKEYKKQIRIFLATSSSFMMLPLKSMATTSLPATTKLPTEAQGIPPELLELLLKLLVITVGSSVILAAILLVTAGVMRMLRKRKEATEWSIDIIKGLVQILVAVPIVFIIYYLANMILGDSGWFISPF